jgi:hypothetical protein
MRISLIHDFAGVAPDDACGKDGLPQPGLVEDAVDPFGQVIGRGRRKAQDPFKKKNENRDGANGPATYLHGLTITTIVIIMA